MVKTLIAVWLGVAALGCQAVRPNAPRHVIRLIVSTAGGVSYSELVNEYTEWVPDIILAPQETTSTLAGLEALQRSQADIGFMMADLTYLAFAGRLPGHERFDRLRGIFTSGVLPLHLLVRSTSHIASVRDLRGRRVDIGVPGSAVERLATSTLLAFDVPLNAVETRPMASMAAVDALESGAIDAVFVIGGYPGMSPVEPVKRALERGARLVPIEGIEAARLFSRNRFFRAAVIPAGTYRGQSTSVNTVGVDNLLICRADLNDDLVYALTRGFFAAVPRSTTLVNSFRLMDLDEAAATTIPLHDGAARYYRERDLFQ